MAMAMFTQKSYTFLISSCNIFIGSGSIYQKNKKQVSCRKVKISPPSSAIFVFILLLLIPVWVSGQPSEMDRSLGGMEEWIPAAGDNLRIAAGKVEVTSGWPYAYNRRGLDNPPSEEELKSITTYEPWHIRAMAIEDGDNLVVFISGEILNWRQNTVDEFRRQLKNYYGLEPHQIILNATHTHSGPDLKVEEYHEYFIKSGVDLVGQILEKLEPARLYFTRGQSEISSNRRGLTHEGFFTRQYNPYGRVDHELILLKAVNTKGDPIAFAVNYACHPTILSSLDIGGGYPGVAMRMVEEQMAGNGIAMFLQGTAGDVKVPNRRPNNPYRQAYFGGPSRVNKYASILTHDIVKTIERNEWIPIEGKITAELGVVELPLMSSVIEPEEEEFAPFTGPERRMVRMAKKMLAAMDENGNYYKTIPCEVYVVKVGEEFVFVGLNGEQTIPIGLRIKGQLLGRPVLVAAYTGPNIGYFPGYALIPEAGYEARTPYSPEAEDFLIKQVMDMVFHEPKQ